MELPRLARKYVEIDVTALLANGSPATITGVDAALVDPDTTPTAATAWTATVYAAGVATILVAGPDGAGSGAIVVPTDKDLWLRVTDSPEVDLARVAKIFVS